MPRHRTRRKTVISIAGGVIGVYLISMLRLSVSIGDDKKHRDLRPSASRRSAVMSPPQRIDINTIVWNISRIAAPTACNQSTEWLVLIHSAPENRPLRDILRRGWAENSDTRRTIFLVGQPIKASLQRQLELESLEHEDMLQGNFVDSYANLTFKNLMGLMWAPQRCPHVRYVIKSDDDTYVDADTLEGFLRSLTVVSRYHIVCHVWHRKPVVRRVDSKWYVSPASYASAVWPDFCSGWLYALPTPTAARLANAAHRLRYSSVDDALVTGVAAQRGRVHRLHARRLISPDPAPCHQWLCGAAADPGSVACSAAGDVRRLQALHRRRSDNTTDSSVCQSDSIAA